MTYESVLALAAAVFVFSLKPGPGILTCMSYSLSHGFKGLAAFIVGFNIGLGLFLAVVFAGLMGIGNLNFDMVFITILAKSLAAVYLIAIGIKEFQKRNDDINPKMKLDAEEDSSLIDIVISAIILTFSNPMIIVFYASIIPVFVVPEIITLNVAVMVAGMLMIIDSFGMVIYCTPLILFRKTMPATFMRHIRGVSAVIIVCIGLYIGYTAIPAKEVLSVFG